MAGTHLEKRLNIGRNIYNACLGEAWRRYKYMTRNPQYWQTVRMEKGKERNRLLNNFKEQYGVRRQNYLKTKRKLAELSQKIADKRKQKHNQYTNFVLSLGLDVRVENMNYKGLQARAKT